MRPTAEGVREALAVADRWEKSPTRPGTPGWGKEVEGLIALAAEVCALQAELDETKLKLWKQPNGLVNMPCEICGEIPNHVIDAHKWFHAAIKKYSDERDNLKWKLNSERNESESRRMRAEAAEAEVSRLKARLELAERVCVAWDRPGGFSSELVDAMKAWREAKK